MPIKILEKTVRGKYQTEAINGFVHAVVMETSDGSFTAQMKFKKRGNVFLTVTLTHSQLMAYLKEGASETFLVPAAMYGVSDESVIHLYNMDLHVTKSEAKSYIAIQQALRHVMYQCDGEKNQLNIS